jgi:hypothetical protein
MIAIRGNQVDRLKAEDSKKEHEFMEIIGRN